MMIYPPIDKLANKCGNRYALSVITAKRARQIKQGATPLVKTSEDEKCISIAAHEIYEDKIIASEE